jgi:hypothetical protein
MKKLFMMLLALATVLSAMPAAFATETEEATEATEAVRAENECGEGITWEFDGGVLYIRGDGQMDDFEDGTAPWQAHKDETEEVIIEGKLTYIGAYAFKDFDALMAVDFGAALYEIGKEAFRSCDALEAVWLPASFKVFGEGSFQSCKNLKEIHSSGRFPSFRQNSMWDTYVTIYFPAERPWGVQYIQQLEEAFKGRVEFLASDGTDPYDPDASTEPEETVSETTEAATEPPAETAAPVTEPEETAAPTQAEMEAEEQTELPTEYEEETAAETAPEQNDGQTSGNGKGGISTGLIIVGAVLIGVGIGSVLFGRKKGKYVR